MSCNCLLANELVALLVSGMAAIMDACVMVFKGPGELPTATILREITNIGYMKILSLKHEYLYSL